jgi:hypothetical protein
MIRYLDSDLRDILASGDLSERAVYDPDGAAKEMSVFYDRPIDLPSTNSPGRASRGTRVHTMTVAKTELPKPPALNDAIEHDGKRYRVSRVLSDGQGMLTLTLFQEKAAAK